MNGEPEEFVLRWEDRPGPVPEVGDTMHGSLFGREGTWDVVGKMSRRGTNIHLVFQQIRTEELYTMNFIEKRPGDRDPIPFDQVRIGQVFELVCPIEAGDLNYYMKIRPLGSVNTVSMRDGGTSVCDDSVEVRVRKTSLLVGEAMNDTTAFHALSEHIDKLNREVFEPGEELSLREAMGIIQQEFGFKIAELRALGWRPSVEPPVTIRLDHLNRMVNFEFHTLDTTAVAAAEVKGTIIL